VTYWGVSATAWVAWTAIGTLALASATAAAIIVGVRTAIADRNRDDTKRAEDRQHEAELRRLDSIEWGRRTNAERQEREDYEARQVTVDMVAQDPPDTFPGRLFNRRIVVRSPAVYPIKQVTVQLGGQAGSGISILPTGHSGSPPYLDNGSTVREYPAQVNLEQPVQFAPIISFVDRHGNLYFQYKGHTERFPQITQFIDAARIIQNWLDTGPKPDEPAA
jgi:hypothetical protein